MPDAYLGPTLINPAMLETVDELRLALHEANMKLLHYSLRENDASAAAAIHGKIVQELGGILSAIMLAHVRGDDAGLKARIEAAIERTKFSLEPGEKTTRH